MPARRSVQPQDSRVDGSRFGRVHPRRLECRNRRLRVERREPRRSAAGRARRAVGPDLPVLLRDGEGRSEEHTSELQSRSDLVCRLLLEKKKKKKYRAAMKAIAGVPRL